MARKRDGLVPIGEALDDLPGPVQARHHFTLADQVNQLVSASEADPDLGFMARTVALCSGVKTTENLFWSLFTRQTPRDLSTGASDAGEFSTSIRVDSPLDFFEHSGRLPARFFEHSGRPIQVVKNK